MVKRHKGFTLVELMVTLVIMGGLLSVALITLRGYIPKQRLLSTVSEMENLLQRAQSEASSRAYWSCIKFDVGPPIAARLFVDTGGNRICGDGSDPNIVTMNFKENVTLESCSGANTIPGCIIWFDATGIPKNCPNGTSCPNDTRGTQGTDPCVDGNYQIIISHLKLEPGARAREIEATSGGIIRTVKPAEKGLLTDLWAAHPAITSGPGTACE